MLAAYKPSNYAYGVTLLIGHCAQKPTRPQSVSEKSQQVIIDQLRNLIKILEGERQEQEKKIQAMTGRLYKRDEA